MYDITIAPITLSNKPPQTLGVIFSFKNIHDSKAPIAGHKAEIGTAYAGPAKSIAY